MAYKKFSSCSIDKDEFYELTPETQVDPSLCVFVTRDIEEYRPLLSIFGDNSVAIRGDRYECNSEGNWEVVERLAMSPDSACFILFGNKTEIIDDPSVIPFYHNTELQRELVSRWSRNAVIWCEECHRDPKRIADYIKSAHNPAVFVGPHGELIVVSDETARPGDIIVRVFVQF